VFDSGNALERLLLEPQNKAFFNSDHEKLDDDNRSDNKVSNRATEQAAACSFRLRFECSCHSCSAYYVRTAAAVLSVDSAPARQQECVCANARTHARTQCCCYSETVLSIAACRAVCAAVADCCALCALR
jgi:hypothetical protein